MKKHKIKQDDIISFEEKWKYVQQILNKYKIGDISKFVKFEGQITSKDFMKITYMIFQLLSQGDGKYYELIIQKFLNQFDRLINEIKKELQIHQVFFNQVTLMSRLFQIFQQYDKAMCHCFMHLFSDNIVATKQTQNCRYQAKKKFYIDILIQNLDELNQSSMDIINQIRIKKFNRYLKKSQSKQQISKQEYQTHKQEQQKLNTVYQYRQRLAKQLPQLFQGLSCHSNLQKFYIKNSNNFFYLLFKDKYLNTIKLDDDSSQKQYFNRIQQIYKIQYNIIQVTQICEFNKFQKNFNDNFLDSPHKIEEKITDLEMYNFQSMFENNNIKNLNKIFKLFLELKHLKILMGFYITYIQDEMKKIMLKYTRGLKKLNQIKTIEQIISNNKKKYILLTKLMLFHMNMVDINTEAFENSMMFISAYYNQMSSKFKILKQFRFDRTLLNQWRKDMAKKKLNSEDFVRIMKTYMFFFRLIGINEYSLTNTIKLCLIQRLQSCSNDQVLERQQLLIDIIRKDGVVDYRQLRNIVLYYSQIKNKKGTVQIINQQKFRLKVLKAECFESLHSSLINTPALPYQLIQKQRKFKEKNHQLNLKIVHLLSQVIWTFKIQKKKKIKIRSNSIQMKLFSQLFNFKSPITLSQLKQSIKQSQDDYLVTIDNLLEMIDKNLIIVSQQDSVSKLSINANYKNFKRQETILQTYFPTTIIKQDQKGNDFRLPGMIVKKMKSQKTMKKTKMIEWIFSQIDIYESIDNIEKVIMKLQSDGFLKIDGNNNIHYIP